MAADASPRDGSDLADDILRAVRRILRKVSEHSRHLARTSGLTVPQLLCLRAIGTQAETREVTVAEVSAQVQLSPPTVSRILDRLEQAGHVVRERRASDRRKVCLSLTPSGLERLEKIPAPLHDAFVSRLTRLGDEELRGLADSLHRVVQLLEAEALDAAPVITPGPDVQDAQPAGGGLPQAEPE